MLSSPNTLHTLTGFRNHLARASGFASYATLSTEEAAMVDDAMEFAHDRFVREVGATFQEREAGITTKAAYTTGTIATTARSVTVTGTTTLWNTDDASGNSTNNVIINDKLVHSSGTLRVTAVASDTSLTLATGHPATQAAGTTYTIGRDEYRLATDMLYLLDIRELASAYTLHILSPQQWAMLTGGAHQAGRPSHACVVGSDPSVATASGINQYLRLWPMPDAVYAFTYTYKSALTWPSSTLVTLPNGTDLLVAAAMSQLALYREKEEMHVRWERRYLSLIPGAKRVHEGRSNARVNMRRGWGGLPAGYPNMPNTITTNL